MIRGYANLAHGQLHYYRWGDPSERTIICAPPVPYGGRYFEPLAEALTGQVQIIGIDPPGYGASDPLPGELSIEAIAKAIADTAIQLDLSEFDLLGFHSGTLDALAMVTDDTISQRVRCTYLIDVPSFVPDTRAQLLADTPSARAFSRELDCLESLWRFNVGRLGEAIPLERGLNLLVQDLQCGSAQPAGFRAAFAYAVEQAIPQLNDVEIHIVGTAGSLLEPTRYLKKCLEQRPDLKVSYEEWLDVESLVFDLHVDRVAGWLLQ